MSFQPTDVKYSNMLNLLRNGNITNFKVAIINPISCDEFTKNASSRPTEAASSRHTLKKQKEEEAANSAEDY